MMDLVVSSGRLTKDERQAARALLERVFQSARLGSAHVTLVLVDDEEMRELNRTWRHKDATTDVLSFAAWEGEAIPGAEEVLGDVIISVDTARRQGRALGHGLVRELAVLFAHGLLHLLGLDHERSHEEARLQAECEMTVLAGAGLSPELALSRRGLP